MLTVTQPDPVAYQALVRQVHRDHKGQAHLARFARQPYAAVLLHRPAGIIPATDLRTGLRSTGEAAARDAIQHRRCALGLLNDDDRLLILAAPPNMTTARSAVTDAVLTRDKIRAIR